MHDLGVIADLIARVHHPPEDRAHDAAEADVHARVEPHPLHRGGAVGQRHALAVGGRADVPRGGGGVAGPAGAVRVPVRDPAAVLRRVPGRRD